MKSRGSFRGMLDNAATHNTLQALKHIEQPDPATWETQRQTFLTKVSEMQQELAITQTPQATPPVANSAGLQRNIFKENSIMAIALKAVVVLTLVFGGTLGTVGAAGASVPGSMLYQFKLQFENWQLNTAKEPLKQAMLAMKFAQHRMDEVEILMNRGEEVPPEVAQRYQEQVKTAVKAGEALPEPLKEQIQNRILTMLELHTQTMTQLRQKMCGECENEEPLQAMVRVMEQTQTKLALKQGQDGEPPADPPDEPGQGKGPGDGSGNGEPPDNGEKNGPGPNSDDKPDTGSGPHNGPGPQNGPGNDDAPEGEPQGPPDGAGDGTPPEDPPGSGPADNAGDGGQDGTCSAAGNCGDGEGDGNNGAGDNGGSDGGEPSGGDNSEGDNSGGENSGGDNGGSGGNGN